jgi:hypothetical protein
LANRWILVNNNSVLSWPDIANDPTMAGKRHYHHAVQGNQVDQPLEDPSAGLSTRVAI